MENFELNAELHATSIEILRECDELKRCAADYALAENEYRLARAKAFLDCELKTVEAKKAHTDLVTGEQRLAAHLAEGMQQASLERVRALRGTLSALQSMASSVRAEAEFARTGPQYDR